MKWEEFLSAAGKSRNYKLLEDYAQYSELQGVFIVRLRFYLGLSLKTIFQT